MQYCIFDDMNQCSEQEVARLLDIASKQRQEQALAYKHLFGQYCCLKSYEILLKLLSSASYTLHTPSFLYNEYGAPCLEKGPFFSISHCRTGIAVAISDKSIGIDIEHIRQAKPELVTRTMNDIEQQEIWASTNPNVVFTKFWTQKEALLKMQGTGIMSIDGIKNTLISTKHIDFLTKVNIEKQYAYTIAFRAEQSL